MNDSFYAILGVDPKATQDDLKDAYRQKAMQYHPDSGGDSADEDKLKAINDIYAILSDPVKRRFYDANDFYDPDFDASIADAAAALFLTIVKKRVRDPVKAAVEHVFSETASYRVRKNNLETEMVRMRGYLNRVESQDGNKKSKFEQAIQANIDEIENDIRTMKRKIIVGDAIRAYFDGVSWKASIEEADQVLYHLGSGQIRMIRQRSVADDD